jgi:Na+/H+-dicarboxylate symporter
MEITGGAASAATAPHKKIYHHLYFQVLCAIVIGVLVGDFYPEFGASLKWLGDLFIKLIKMLIAPIIFCTVVYGIASMEDMKKVGRVGGKGGFARITSMSLYKMHLIALYGSANVALEILTQLLTHRTEPSVKLH